MLPVRLRRREYSYEDQPYSLSPRFGESQMVFQRPHITWPHFSFEAQEAFCSMRKSYCCPVLAAMLLHHLRQFNSKHSFTKKERVTQHQLASVGFGQTNASIPVELDPGVNMRGYITQLREIGPAVLGSVRTQIQEQRLRVITSNRRPQSVTLAQKPISRSHYVARMNEEVEIVELSQTQVAISRQSQRWPLEGYYRDSRFIECFE